MNVIASETPVEGAVPERDVHYTVVRNHEEQHSVWRVDEAVPNGWHEVGVTGTREQCFTYIEEAWPDLCPLSLRTAR